MQDVVSGAITLAQHRQPLNTKLEPRDVLASCSTIGEKSFLQVPRVDVRINTCFAFTLKYSVMRVCIIVNEFG